MTHLMAFKMRGFCGITVMLTRASKSDMCGL